MARASLARVSNIVYQKGFPKISMMIFDCPICLESMEKRIDEVELNCGHRICYNCFYLYMERVKDSLQNWRTPIENSIPKCPMCRSLIHTLCGNKERLEGR